MHLVLLFLDLFFYIGCFVSLTYDFWTRFGHIYPETKNTNTGDSIATINTPTKAQWIAICVLVIHADI